jgi:hypothetical protein
MTEHAAHDARAGHEPTEHLTFAEAAERLHITPNAVRMRVHRGTLASVRVNDRTLVVWPQPEQPHARRTEHARADERAPVQSDDRLIARLESENAFLRAELESRTEETRRLHHLIAGFIERLPELPAGDVSIMVDSPQERAAATQRDEKRGVVSDSLIARLRRLIGRG